MTRGESEAPLSIPRPEEPAQQASRRARPGSPAGPTWFETRAERAPHQEGWPGSAAAPVLGDTIDEQIQHRLLTRAGPTKRAEARLSPAARGRAACQ